MGKQVRVMEVQIFDDSLDICVRKFNILCQDSLFLRYIDDVAQ